ncbi:MAG TPA: acetate kinase [Ktedonobacteraceae bacterium]|nr:acetate kinase [Ktedonobacteraceae bacterium]
MMTKILVLNAGSSSQKSCLYEIDEKLPGEPPQPLWTAHGDWTRQNDRASLTVSTLHGQKIEQQITSQERGQILQQILKTLWQGPTKVIEHPSEITLVGHRVVHGGPEYRTSIRVTPTVIENLRKISEFAPLHNPANLEGIKIIEQLLGDTPQIAVFDTAFHRHLLPESTIYPGPYAWYEQHLQRYGFHGISHQYCTQRIADIVQRDPQELRIINCHLGNGCSLAAIRDGHSIDTTMGFTPLEGLMMGTRSGSIDPGILFYLQREKGYTAEQLDHQLNKESGLLGISGVSGDLRLLHEAIQQGNARAKLAVDIFVHRLRSCMGAMLAVLGGVDVIAFTGGIGENDPQIRARACDAFGFLHLELDEAKNQQSPADQEISTSTSAVRVLLIHTEEDWEIARECWKLSQAQ